MSHVALTILAPVARRDALVAALDALDQSPLARIPGLHMGRLTTIETLPVGPLLLMCLDADGPLEAVLAAVGPACGALFAFCTGCPEPEGPAFRRWLLSHRVKDRWTIMPYEERTLPEVQEALRAREELGAFAVRADGLAPAELRRAFRAAFG